MNAQPAFITPTAETLERAGLRLDLAESVFLMTTCPRKDGTVPVIDEHTFGKAEAELIDARRTYRALFELRTGLGWETTGRRLSA